MRVLLIQPDCPINNRYNPAGSIVLPPLGLEYIAAHVQDIAETQIIDNRINSLAQITKEIQHYRPDYVGISCCFTLEIDQVLKIAKIAKENRAITVVGGWHPTLLVDETLSSPWIDIIVRSEGEFVFRELIQKNSPIGIQGVSYKQNGQIINNPDRPLADLNQYRIPTRTLRRPETKAYYGYSGFPIDCMETSRGCPYQCTFCSVHKFYRHTYRHRSISHIMQEIRELRKHTRSVYFIDDNFVVNPKHTMKLCDAIIRERLNMFFMSTARADMVLRHPEVFKRMAEAGFVIVFLGLESFSNKTLQNLHKQLQFKQIKSAIKILHNFGFFIQGNVILGADFSDTEADLQSTIEIAKTLDIDIPTFSILTPYPGTELMERVMKENRLFTRDWRNFNWVTPTMRYPHLTPDQLAKYHLKAYAEVPAFSHPSKRINRVLRTRFLPFFIRRGLNLETIRGLFSVIKHRHSLVTREV
jgi:anaerobic magnesium-protoporphyrin IX monomethyl ester cyclase